MSQSGPSLGEQLAQLALRRFEWLSRVTLPDHFLSLARLRAPTRL
jgi:hypothetical protein